MAGASNVVVIGSGWGGLAAAIRLQAAGHQVTLVEALDRLGGRARQFSMDGYTFDMGTSIVTAPDLLQDLWASAGQVFEDDVTLVPIDPWYRIDFQDGVKFRYSATVEGMEEEIHRLDPQRGVAGYRRMMEATGEIYRRAFQQLAHEPFVSFGDFVKIVPDLVKFQAQRSVWGYMGDFFKEPHLRTIFSFHPLFLGGNPLRASLIYSVIPYLERTGGVWYVTGGIGQLVAAFGRLFERLGGEVRLNANVEQITLRGRQVTGVRLADGTELAADLVVANSDVAWTYTRLLPAGVPRKTLVERMQKYHYSMSCHHLYLAVDKDFPQLQHHTVLMPNRFREHVSNVFDGDTLGDDIAIYAHNPVRTDPSMAPPGKNAIYALTPVPNLRAPIDWERERGPFRDRVIDALEQHVGMTGLREAIVAEREFTPVDFQDVLQSYQGGAFSIEPTLFQSAYFRPHNRAQDIGGLYFVGAGTHPGAGLPGTLLSADITARLVREDLASGRLAR